MQPQRGRSRFLTEDQVATLWADARLPAAQERANSLILWIGDHQPSPGATTSKITELALDAWIGSELPQVPGGAQGLRWLVGAMEPNAQTQHLFAHNFIGGIATFQMTLAGWAKYAELQKPWKESKTAFMAMKFGDAELNTALDKCFRVAVRRAGFELKVLSDAQAAGLIDDQIRSGILAARFVIADLTHGSRGAYWEAGFAEGLGLPVIYTCKEAFGKRSRRTLILTTCAPSSGRPVIWSQRKMR
jgi:hypothetical protein